MPFQGKRLPMSGIDVSVVVSTYQRCNSLRRTLDSLIDQRTPDDVRYEIIVVDNNCTDNTREVVQEYIGLFPELVRYAFEPRPGVSNGRNAGICAARGQIVAFTDDDNEVAPTWVATLVSVLRANPELAGVGGRVIPEWPGTPPKWLDRRHWSPLAILDYGERPFLTSVRRPLCLLTANLAIRRDVLIQVGGFSPEFPRCQDHELLIRLWRSGERVLYAPELVAFAPIDPRRLSRPYHRRWHARHGHFAAAMRLEEATDDRGQLRQAPPDTPRLLGSPGYVYADAAKHVRRWIVAAARRQWARSAHHEHRVRYLLAYIRRTAALNRAARTPLLREALAFVRVHFQRRARIVNMSMWRLIVAHAVILLLIAGSAYDIITGREHWPFSPYPMFSSVERSRTLDSLLLTGVAADPNTAEIPLRDAAFILPFDQCRLNTAMQRARSSVDAGARLHAMLEDCLARYEAQRLRGAHDGPPLRAVRLYDAHWTLAAGADNANRPDSTRLIDEVAAAAPSTVETRAANAPGRVPAPGE
jgi:glycosyltransferase involved in cell wall biosynthesis